MNEKNRHDSEVSAPDSLGASIAESEIASEELVTVGKFYESARQELISRLQLRDNALFVFLATTGTIFGVAVGSTARLEILLIIPFLSLSLGFVVLQHHEVIGALGFFCERELGGFYQRKGIHKVLQWDSSTTLVRFHGRLVGARSPAHAAILLSPGYWAVAVNWKHLIPTHWREGFFWAAVFGLCCEIILTVWIWRAHRFRSQELHPQRRDGSEPLSKEDDDDLHRSGGRLSMTDEIGKVAENDLRKLHSEVNQIVQQRFYLTTIALIIFGTVCGWTTSALGKDKPVDWRFVFLAEFLLIAILFGLYVYFMLLLGMMRVLTVYIKEKYDSPWERDWHNYRREENSRHYLGYSKAGTVIFQTLGGLSLCFFTSLLYLANQSRGWQLLVDILPMVVVVAMYELAIHFVTRLRHRIINEKKIATDWKTAIEKNPKM
jgi:FtsH-binding integral membrane protein